MDIAYPPSHYHGFDYDCNHYRFQSFVYDYDVVRVIGSSARAETVIDDDAVAAGGGFGVGPLHHCPCMDRRKSRG